MHDYAKDIPDDKLLAIAQEQGIIKDEAEILAPYILHGPVGAYLLRERKIITIYRISPWLGYFNIIRYKKQGKI